MSHSFIGQKKIGKGWWNQVHSVTDCMSSSSSWIGVTRLVRFDEFKIKQTSKKKYDGTQEHMPFSSICDSFAIVIQTEPNIEACPIESWSCIWPYSQRARILPFVCLLFFFGFAVWVVLVHCNRADRVTQYGVIWRFKYYRKTTCRLTKGAHSADTRPFYNWIYMWSLFVCLFANIRSSITT